MSKTDMSDPAFPTYEKIGTEVVNEHGYIRDVFGAFGGMTLRDYFAARYMQGMCGSKFYTDGNLMDGEIADHAYAMADAMLKAREA